MPPRLHYDRVGHVVIIAQLVFRVMSSGTSQQTILGDDRHEVGAVCIPSTSTNEQSEPKQKWQSYTRNLGDFTRHMANDMFIFQYRYSETIVAIPTFRL